MQKTVRFVSFFEGKRERKIVVGSIRGSEEFSLDGVLDDYYREIKEAWTEIQKSCSTHALMDLVLEAEELFFH